MKSLLFILLAGYAARSDENNYYVIEMPNDPPIETKKPFKVYWNVPTMQCSSKKIDFENLYEKFGIIQNDMDKFKGEKVTILYDPGLFPALFKNETSGKFRFRNGGVPQEGDLQKHMDAFKNDLDLSIPDRDFSGIGIIDFESWRPVFRQNFGVLQPYKQVSYEIERKLHWWWQKPWIEAEAKRRFEEAASIFMKTTLIMAKQLRPNALWGFYGFPYCFNMASNNMVESCASHVPEENDQIGWLWRESTALYPSVYSSAQLATSQLAALVRGRVREAARCAKGRAPILPYFWYRYRDAGFLNETDLNTALSTLYQSNATGAIIWGSSNDVNTVAKCTKLLNYIENDFGPAIAKYTKPTNKLNYEITSTTNTLSTTFTTQSPLFNDVSNSNTDKDIDLEFYWDLPENITQDVDNHVKEDLSHNVNVTSINDSDIGFNNNSILIDLIFNRILTNVNSTSTISTVAPNIKNDKKDHLIEVDLQNTDVYNHLSTETSQVINNVVTNNLSSHEINRTTLRDKSQTKNNTIDLESTEYDDIMLFEDDQTYQQTTVVSPNVETGYTNTISGLSITDSVIQLATTESDIYETAENDYDNTFDDDESYFFNFDTFGKEFTTMSTTDSVITSFVSNTSKNNKKGNFVSIPINGMENKETTKNTEFSMEEYHGLTTSPISENEQMTDPSTDSISLGTVLSIDSTIVPTTGYYTNIDNYITQTSTQKNERSPEKAKNYPYDNHGSILTTAPDETSETNFVNLDTSSNKKLPYESNDSNMNTSVQFKIPNTTNNPGTHSEQLETLDIIKQDLETNTSKNVFDTTNDSTEEFKTPTAATNLVKTTDTIPVALIESSSTKVTIPEQTETIFQDTETNTLKNLVDKSKATKFTKKEEPKTSNPENIIDMITTGKSEESDFTGITKDATTSMMPTSDDQVVVYY